MLTTFKIYVMKKEDHVKKIIEVLCEYYGMSKDIFNSKSRKNEIILVRHLAVYVIRYETGMTYREIGEFLGKETSTITRNFQNISDIIKNDHFLQKEIKEIKELLKA